MLDHQEQKPGERCGLVSITWSYWFTSENMTRRVKRCLGIFRQSKEYYMVMVVRWSLVYSCISCTMMVPRNLPQNRYPNWSLNSRKRHIPQTSYSSSFRIYTSLILSHGRMWCRYSTTSCVDRSAIGYQQWNIFVRDTRISSLQHWLDMGMKKSHWTRVWYWEKCWSTSSWPRYYSIPISECSGHIVTTYWPKLGFICSHIT